MAARLTDKQKKKILADYTELESYSATAKANGVSKDTVRRLVASCSDFARKAQDKKDENTADIIAYMESKRNIVCEILGKGLEALNSPEKLAEASPAQITTALGTLIDKWVSLKDSKEETAQSESWPGHLDPMLIADCFHPVHRDIMEGKHTEYIFSGGRGSTKSSFVSLVLVELLKNNPGMHALVVRQVSNTLKDSVYNQLKWAIDTIGLNDDFDFKLSPLEIIHKPTKQRIFFRGADDPLKIKSIKPEFGYIGILWFEELDQFRGPEAVRSIEQSAIRGGDTAYIIKSFNPPKTNSNWANKYKLEQNEKRLDFHSTYETVPREWLGKSFLDQAEHLKEVDPDAYEHEYLGIANGTGGMVFDRLELRTITDEEIIRFDRVYNGLDFGWYPDPLAFERVHYDTARETIYIFGEIVGNKITNAAAAEEIIAAGYNDTFTTCDSAEPKSIFDLRDCGINAKEAVKGPGSVEYSMKWLQGKRIVIDQKRCPYAAREFSSYEYDRDKDGEVISGYPDRDNHTIDAVRYALERLWQRRGNL